MREKILMPRNVSTLIVETTDEIVNDYMFFIRRGITHEEAQRLVQEKRAGKQKGSAQIINIGHKQ